MRSRLTIEAITADGIGGFTFTDRDNRELLAGYRQRQAAHRELGRIRGVAAQVARRRRERSARFTT
jgi:hypothetical protein